MSSVTSFQLFRRVINCARRQIRLGCAKRGHCSSASTKSSQVLLQHLIHRIQASGPLTVSEYMKECLTNPVYGYYMKSDVFGAKGDFITSPEISQMFGELLAIWGIHEWQQWGQPNTLQVVELGPGRGTLAADMLRTFSKIKEFTASLSLHLVEVSPRMQELQIEQLCGDTRLIEDIPPEGRAVKSARSKYGIPVHWYKCLDDVPEECSYYIAHEFLDALPIHKFQKTEKGWCEVMIDVSGTSELQFVLSPGPTSNTVLLQPFENDTRDHIEVCPEAGILVQKLAQRLQNNNGWVLLADYGHSGDKTDTLRGFKSHKLHDVLIDPGSTDLTADVDFSYLHKIAGDKVLTYGPITQTDYLHAMGIHARLHVLLQTCTESERQNLLTAYNMLTDRNKMGERFKFFAMTSRSESKKIPAAFW